MTLVPHHVTSRRSLADAGDSMDRFGIGHLPVMDDGRLVGLLSARDVQTAARLGMDAKDTPVASVMLLEPFTVPADEELTRVAREMARRRVDCAVVTEGARIRGILTATDALALLADAVGASGALVPPNRLPSVVKRRIEGEHEYLRQVLDRVENLSERALCEEADPDDLFAAARELYQKLIEHIELEDVLLAPAVRESCLGPARAKDLVEKHHEQRVQLEMALAMLDSGDVEHLAQSLLLLAHTVRVDMKREEQTVLSSLVLDDSLVESDMMAG